MNIIISGSLAYDRIMDFPGYFSTHILPEKIHALNVCFTVNGLIEKFGGTAGNIAYALSLLGETPIILANRKNRITGQVILIHQMPEPEMLLLCIKRGYQK